MKILQKNAFKMMISTIFVNIIISVVASAETFKGSYFQAELHQHPGGGGHSVLLGGDFSTQINNLSKICWNKDWLNRCTKTFVFYGS